MIVFGVILFILGLLFGIGLLETLGIVIAVIGLVLLLLGGAGHPVGGRRYWY
jgi:hypothetical protein